MPSHLAAYRITRPARGLVLVPIPDGAPWQTAMLSALRGQAATWGGAANLLVPWTDDLLDRPELWALAETLDPDSVLTATMQGAGDRDLRGTLKAFAERMPILQ